MEKQTTEQPVMEKQVTLKQLFLGIALAITPNIFTMFTTSMSDEKNKNYEQEIIIQNHELRIQLQEKNIDLVVEKLDKAISAVNQLKVEIAKSQQAKNE